MNLIKFTITKPILCYNLNYVLWIKFNRICNPKETNNISKNFINSSIKRIKKKIN